jgi:hypothetical protein
MSATGVFRPSGASLRNFREVRIPTEANTSVSGGRPSCFPDAISAACALGAAIDFAIVIRAERRNCRLGLPGRVQRVSGVGFGQRAG